MNECRYCGKENAEKRVTTTGALYACDECFNMFYVKCARCGNYCDTEMVNALGVCHLCLEKEQEEKWNEEQSQKQTKRCEFCLERDGEPVDLGKIIAFMCDKCYEHTFVYCTRCGKREFRVAAHGRICEECYKKEQKE